MDSTVWDGAKLCHRCRRNVCKLLVWDGANGAIAVDEARARSEEALSEVWARGATVEDKLP